MGLLDDVIAVEQPALGPNVGRGGLGVALADVPDVRGMVVVALLEAVRLVANTLRKRSGEAGPDGLLRLLAVQDAVHVGVAFGNLMNHDESIKLTADPRAELALESLVLGDVSAQSENCGLHCEIETCETRETRVY